MSLFKYINPFYWLPEDETVRCGVYIFSLRKPEDDPYIEACRVDDRLTETNGWGENHLELPRLIQAFHDMVNTIQAEFPIGSKDWMLGEKYKKYYDIFIPLFFHSKKGKK